MRAPSHPCHVSPQGSWSQAVTLLADTNGPGSQEDMVNNWEPAHSLVEDAVSGAKIIAAIHLPALALACLSLCLWGAGVYLQPASSSLVFTQSFVLWAHQWSQCCIIAFYRKGNIYIFHLWIYIYSYIFHLWQAHSLGWAFSPSPYPEE